MMKKEEMKGYKEYKEARDAGIDLSGGPTVKEQTHEERCATCDNKDDCKGFVVEIEKILGPIVDLVGNSKIKTDTLEAALKVAMFKKDNNGAELSFTLPRDGKVHKVKSSTVVMAWIDDEYNTNFFIHGMESLDSKIAKQLVEKIDKIHDRSSRMPDLSNISDILNSLKR